MKKETRKKVNKAISDFSAFLIVAGFMTFVPAMICCMVDMFWFEANAGWVGEELLCAATIEILFGMFVLFIRYIYYEIKKEIKKKRRVRYERKNAQIS